MLVNIKTSLNSVEKNYKGTFLNNRIVYIDDGVKTIVDIDKKLFIRENNDNSYKIELDFLNDEYKVYINNHMYVNINLILKTYEYIENKVKIAYSIDDENYDYEIIIK